MKTTRLIAILSLIGLASVCCTSTAIAAEAGVIVGWNNDGNILFNELNCVACHKTDNSHLPFPAKEAPRLGNIGQRVSPEYLFKFLADPHETKPGTSMPDILHSMPAAERAKATENLVHFLVSRNGPIDATPVAANKDVIEKGRNLYHQVGCVACHAAHDKPPQHKTDGKNADKRTTEPPPQSEIGQVVPHPDLKTKTTVSQLATFIANPLNVRPAGRMPSLGLSSEDSIAIASYLLRDQVEENQFRLPTAKFEVDSQKAKLGRQLFAEIGCASCHDTAVHQLPTLVDFKLLGAKVEGFDDNDNRSPGGESPAHAIDGKTATKYLNFGLLNSGLLISLQKPLIVGGLTISSANDSPDRDPAEYLLEGSNDGEKYTRIDSRPIPPFSARFQPQAFRFNNEMEYSTYRLTITKMQNSGANAMQFSELQFYSSVKPQPGIPSRLEARPLKHLTVSATGGCLSANVGKGRPRFDLSATQRAALAESLPSIQKQPKPLSAKAAVDLTMNAFRCYACHNREGKGGPSNELADYFVYEKLVDLGDEGRLPPPLERVGAKLTEEGFHDMLVAGDRYRAFMATRMPQFGLKNIGHLPKQFAEADRKKLPPYSPSKLTSKLVDDGRTLAGKGALACINCHVWGDSKLPGAEGMDLQKTQRRIRKEWFHAWLKTPQKLRKGTRMPSSWPQGKSFFPTIQEGDVDLQIDALWAYLSAGNKGGLPAGLAPADRTRLIVTDKPIVFRTFFDKVSAHTILVGFRQQSHVAFDANRIRMALAWSGDFAATKQSWDGRAGQYTPLPSNDVVNFPDGPSFAQLESADATWPKDVPKAKLGSNRTPPGWKFNGYRYDAERVPTFLYQAGSIAVEETPVAEFELGTGVMVRQFHLTATQETKNLYFLVARGKEIRLEGKRYVVDGNAKYDIKDTGIAPIIRATEAGQELLLPISFPASGKRQAEFQIRVAW
jgi:cytochrome c553